MKKFIMAMILVLETLSTPVFSMTSADRYWKMFKPGSTEGIEEMLKANLNFETRNKYDQAGLWWAVETNAPNLVKLFIDFGADPCNQRQTPTGTMSVFHLAAAKGQLESLNHILNHIVQNKKNIDPFDDFGRTPLFLSVMNEQSECVKMLLAAGADRTISEDFGMTPLHTAKQHNFCKIIELLENYYPILSKN